MGKNKKKDKDIERIAKGEGIPHGSSDSNDNALKSATESSGIMTVRMRSSMHYMHYRRKESYAKKLSVSFGPRNKQRADKIKKLIEKIFQDKSGKNNWN